MPGSVPHSTIVTRIISMTNNDLRRWRRAKSVQYSSEVHRFSALIYKTAFAGSESTVSGTDTILSSIETVTLLAWES